MIKTLFIFFAMMATSSLYMNCSGTNFSSDSEKGSQENLAGGGIDGKLKYLSYGACGAATDVKVKDVILVAGDLSSATKMREDCQDLSVPQTIPVSQLQFALKNTGTFAVNGKIFDVQLAAAAQKVTVAFCKAPSANVLVWKNMDGTASHSGEVVQTDGASTGAKSVQTPVAAGEYRSLISGANSFQLDVNSGSLTYALANGTPVSLSGLNCNTQTPPAQAAAVNLMTNPGFENGLIDYETHWGNGSTVTAGAYTGTTSVRVGRGEGGVYQDVTANITPGSTYNLSFAARLASIAETGAEIGIEFFDVNGNVIHDQHIVPASTTWTTHSFNVTCPAASTRVLVYVWKGVGASSYVYADDFVLSRSP